MPRGRVLDGRDRLAACEIAGVEPMFVTYADGDPDGFALAVNINRRHLKAGARHLITEMARRVNGATQGNYAKLHNADQARLAEAGVVLDYSIDGDLRDDVLIGDKGLQAAAEIAAAVEWVYKIVHRGRRRSIPPR